MSPIRKHALLFTLLFAALTSTHAQSRENFLSLDRAINLAVEHDIQLLPQKNAWQLAQVRQESQMVWEDPEVRVGAKFSSQPDSYNSTLRLYLPHPWKVKASALENASRTALTEAEFQMGKIVLISDIYRLYREIQCLEKEIELAARLTTIKKERALLIERQMQSAMSTSSQVLLLKWDVRTVEREERELRRTFKKLKAYLATRTGLPSKTLQLPSLDLAKKIAAKSSAVAIQSALRQRPDLHLLQASLQQANSQLKQIQAERIPWINHVQTSYSEQNNEWGMQVAISVPLFSLNSSKTTPARAERAMRQTSIVLSEQTISRQVQEKTETLNDTLEEWAMQQTEQTELEKAIAVEITKLKKFAASNPSAWLVLEEKLVQSKQRLLKTRRSVDAAQADLLLATGQTPDAESPEQTF